MILDGRKIKKEILDGLSQKIKDKADRKPPALAIIIVGEDPSSLLYIGIKEKVGIQIGVNVLVERFNKKESQEKIIEQIEKYNQNEGISGIIVQLPLPNHLDMLKIINSINPEKDVDGLTDFNQQFLYNGSPKIIPATPRGIVELLKYYEIPIINKKVVVVGRSRLVGAPIAELCRQNGAEVEVCHRSTKNTHEIVKNADILISAAGQPGLFNGENIKTNAVVIDVGITKNDSGLVGDVDFESANPVASYITPVPGGVGQMTIAALFENLIDCWEKGSK
jgi:methylenetetrahydrofolate dehydrogenase (NADP+)/methenyltetrahydrofolate cyclohydrolase